MQRWKKLSTRQLLAHLRLTVYEDEVELPNGTRTDYLYFGAGLGAVCVLAINAQREILLQKEYSYPPDEWLYQIPGGGIEEGETLEAAANRELAKEAGVTGTLRKLGWFYPDNRRRSDKMHVFVATDLKPRSARKDPEEAFESYWFTAEHIEKLITSGEIHNYATLAAWSFLRASSTYPEAG